MFDLHFFSCYRDNFKPTMQHIVLVAGPTTEGGCLNTTLTRIVGGPMRARDCIPLSYNFSRRQRTQTLPSKLAFTSPTHLQSALKSICQGATRLRDIVVVSWQDPVFVPQPAISTILVCAAGGLCKQYCEDAARSHLCIWVHDDAPLHRVQSDIRAALASRTCSEVSIRVVPMAAPDRGAVECFGSSQVW